MNKDILKVGDQAQIIPGSTFLNDKKINEDIQKESDDFKKGLEDFLK